jgi:cell division protein ZapA
MSEVSVSINGKRYRIACDDGQEAHITRLARYIDQRVGELVASVGPQVGEAQLLVMASLLIADELSDAYSKLEGRPEALPDDGKDAEAAALATGQTIESLAKRVEAIAEGLKRP